MCKITRSGWRPIKSLPDYAPCRYRVPFENRRGCARHFGAYMPSSSSFSRYLSFVIHSVCYAYSVLTQGPS
ncbi:hypothetical protein K466DRAFT_584267 [Polyporus arcularius HHB13444]|uniref:Uncharacterized protein n=1 Tax=Polyporus arcularius HHB13444 TaxID=1314778 RepID=A0A5C3PUP8_9APHY|nr:hypothetical protein K466DRAFT_584267 [Polyporus arcularius HHB13444]